MLYNEKLKRFFKSTNSIDFTSTSKDKFKSEICYHKCNNLPCDFASSSDVSNDVNAALKSPSFTENKNKYK